MTQVSIGNMLNLERMESLAQVIGEEMKEAEKAEKIAEEAKNESKAEEAESANKTDGAPEADQIAANASKAKADKLEAFARAKVEKLVKSSMEIETHLKTQFDILEKILMGREFKTQFDPNSKAHLKQVEKLILGILESTPEIKTLEK